jgi:hypothetical protein
LAARSTFMPKDHETTQISQSRPAEHGPATTPEDSLCGFYKRDALRKLGTHLAPCPPEESQSISTLYTPVTTTGCGVWRGRSPASSRAQVTEQY